MPTDPDNLTFATTEELIDELGRRHLAVCISTIKIIGGGEAHNIHWRGGFTLAMGLAARAEARMKDASIRCTSAPPNHDDTMPPRR